MQQRVASSGEDPARECRVGVRTAILLNKRSGSAPDAAELARACDKYRIAAEIQCMPEQEVRAWATGIAREFDVLVAAGGDGTVSIAASAAAEADKTLGVIPAGTLNHFARDAGIPLDIDKAIGLIANGTTRRLHVAVVNDRIFVNNASIGAYPRMVWERHKARQRGLPRPVASAVAVMETWLELRNLTASISIGDGEFVRRTPIIVVGNGEYEVEGTQLGKRETLNNGRLSLYVAPGLGRAAAIALPLRALLGRLKSHDKFEAWTGTSIVVRTAHAHVGVALDGEITRLEVPLRFTIKRNALKVIVPEAKAT